MTSKKIDHFKNASNALSFQEGETILHEGDVGHTAYVVQEGEVKILYKGRVLDTLSAGDIFGEMSLVDDSPRSAEVIAATDCKVVPIDEERFMFMVHETPTFALKVMRVMADRLRRMTATTE
ncbi:MAG: cyclic nucleotide-binding domain-containing protein [Anaerolineae bacterium]|nr:cyclic nucleotide-binding domain-containing protein [Anaerolineae bacterium]